LKTCCVDVCNKYDGIKFDYDVVKDELTCLSTKISINDGNETIHTIQLNRMLIQRATEYIANNVDLKGCNKRFNLVSDSDNYWYHHIVDGFIHETHMAASLPSCGIMDESI